MPKQKTPSIIAIDGPAASGKSSVGKHVAEKLGYLFLDTGIMYRAVTYAVISKGIDVHDENSVGKIAKNLKIQIEKSQNQDGRIYDIYVDTEDVTKHLRSQEVNKFVSVVSKYAGVRSAMTAQQKEIGRAGSIVMAGRDIGTVVLPEADLKIYLEATPHERAQRRYKEEISKGKDISFEEILKNVQMRDEIDSNRAIAPLKPAKDAHIINTDGKDIEQVTEEIFKLIRI